MSAILGIIPARGGSKSIPRKNLTRLFDRPLLAYTTEAAVQSRSLSRVILSTDDEEIAEFGRSAGVEVPFVRPAEHATDTATVEAVVRHTLMWLADAERYVPSAFVILQPTTPLRTSRHIDEAIALFSSSDVDSVISVSPPMEHPCDMVYFEDRRMCWTVPKGGYGTGAQRQGYPDSYFINGAVYITRTSAFAETGSRFGRTTLPYVMEQLDSIDIDSDADLVIASLLLRRREEMRSSAR